MLLPWLAELELQLQGQTPIVVGEQSRRQGLRFGGSNAKRRKSDEEAVSLVTVTICSNERVIGTQAIELKNEAKPTVSASELRVELTSTPIQVEVLRRS